MQTSLFDCIDQDRSSFDALLTQLDSQIAELKPGLERLAAFDTEIDFGQCGPLESLLALREQAITSFCQSEFSSYRSSFDSPQHCPYEFDAVLASWQAVVEASQQRPSSFSAWLRVQCPDTTAELAEAQRCEVHRSRVARFQKELGYQTVKHLRNKVTIRIDCTKDSAFEGCYCYHSHTRVVEFMTQLGEVLAELGEESAADVHTFLEDFRLSCYRFKITPRERVVDTKSVRLISNYTSFLIELDLSLSGRIEDYLDEWAEVPG